MPTGPTRFVVQMHWAFQTQGHLFLVLDYCSGARAAWLSCAKMCGRLRNLTSSSNIGRCESRRPAFGSAINPPFNEVAPLWTKWTCRPPKKRILIYIYQALSNRWVARCQLVLGEVSVIYESKLQFKILMIQSCINNVPQMRAVEMQIWNT